jgi:hypothetical protein
MREGDIPRARTHTYTLIGRVKVCAFKERGKETLKEGFVDQPERHFVFSLEGKKEGGRRREL